jgi:hypothetical protein
MCTVTFVPRPNGYYLAMNRDELLTRIAGLPPAKRIVDGRAVLCPSEPGGGTWIAVNDSSTSFTLINWYSVTARVKSDSISRGTVVKAVSAATSFCAADAALARMSLSHLNPFRLIGILPVHGEIAEWKWDLNELICRSHPWKARQWISSGFDEPLAQRIRSETFRRAQKQSSAGTLAWLRHLHRSHLPGAGPFSVCMHRSDAATVSYTEIIATSGQTTMRYDPAAPCHKQGRFACHRLFNCRQAIPTEEHSVGCSSSQTESMNQKVARHGHQSGHQLRVCEE